MLAFLRNCLKARGSRPAESVVNGFWQCGTAVAGALPEQPVYKAPIAGSGLFPPGNC